MPVSRRSFVKSAGLTGLSVLAVPVAGRGSEASRERMLDAITAGNGSNSFAADERARGRLALKGAVRLDSNENPNGPGQAALDAIRAAFGETARYPDVPADDARRTIAKHFGVAPENVLAGCGSGEVLRMAVYAFTSPERALVTAAPSFEDPVAHAAITRAPVRAIPVDGQLGLDLGRMSDAAAGAGLVFLCNPNNPTATVHGAAAVRDFVAQVHRRNPDCVVLVDEAYHEYVDDPSYATAVPMALEDPRVVVVRTFSKVFGMAGLRLGYAIGQAETLRAMKRHSLPNNINVLAAAAAVATLPDSTHVERERALNRDAREFTRRAFEEMGHRAGVSHTNFVMVPIGRDSRWFRDACAEKGILVGRPFPPLTNHARISIGTMDEMTRAVDVFRRVLSGATN